MQETKAVIEINANMGIEVKDLVSLCLLVWILISQQARIVMLYKVLTKIWGQLGCSSVHLSPQDDEASTSRTAYNSNASLQAAPAGSHKWDREFNRPFNNRAQNNGTVWPSGSS